MQSNIIFISSGILPDNYSFTDLAIKKIKDERDLLPLLQENEQKFDLLLVDTSLAQSDSLKQIVSEADALFNIPIMFFIDGLESEIKERTNFVFSYGFISKESGASVFYLAVKNTIKLHKKYYKKRAFTGKKDIEEEFIYQGFYSSQDALIISTIEDSTIIAINDSFTKLTGYDIYELENKSLWKDDYGFWADPKDRSNIYSLLTHNEEVNDYQVLVKHKNGKIIDCLLRAIVLVVNNEKCIRIVLRDNTIQKYIEDSHKHSGDIYHILLDNSSDPIFSISEEGFYIYVNEAFSRGVGLEQSYIIGRKLWDIFPKNEADYRFNSLTEVIRSGKPKVIEAKVNGADIYLTTIQPFNLDSGRRCVICISKDITIQKEQEAAITKSKEDYKLLVDNYSDMIVKTDINGHYLFVSPTYCKLFGKTEKELLGNTYQPLVYEEDKPIVQKAVEKLFSPPYTCQYEERALTIYGWRWISWSSKSVLDQSGKVVALVGTGRDINDRKLAELQLAQYSEELKTLNATKDKFLSILAHDLRGPFHGFLGVADLLINQIDNFTKNEIVDLAKSLKRSLEKQFGLLNDLLDWSRLASGRLVLYFEEIQLSFLVKEILSMLSMVANQKSITLENEVEDNIILNADVKMIQLIFRNLVTNAIKFTNEGGKVKVYAANKDGFVFVTVEDNGIGIEEEYIDRLFKMGSQFTSKGTASEEGTGLGLILCNEIIEKHSGKIWVESKVNEGSRFIFKIPLAAKETKN